LFPLKGQNAAGHGWFIDPTPANGSGFLLDGIFAEFERKGFDNGCEDSLAVLTIR
jgi:hypothetical protein